jgi:hypothetical protein
MLMMSFKFSGFVLKGMKTQVFDVGNINSN